MKRFKEGDIIKSYIENSFYRITNINPDLRRNTDYLASCFYEELATWSSSHNLLDKDIERLATSKEIENIRVLEEEKFNRKFSK